MRKIPHKSATVIRRFLLAFMLLGGLAGGVAAIALNLAGESPPAVLSEEARKSFSSPDEGPYSLSGLLRRLPPEGVEQVGRYLEYFRINKKRGLGDALARSTKYLATYRRIFRKEGLPEELAYLPLIESGFVENAVSPAKAVGVWQFTEATARRFNLISNSWFDKRRDPIKSAYAAASYLKHLHKKFHDWDLALAGYNSGAGTVNWALRVNRKAELPTHFWALDLPEETRNYVPAFIASVLIAKNPGAYGFEKIQFHPRVTYDRIKVAPSVSLYSLAEQLGVEEAELRKLNPELIRGEIPPFGLHYALRIPPGTGRNLPSKLGGISQRLSNWVLYRLNESDTVQELASRYSSKPGRIMKVNQLKEDSDLFLREFLIIPL